MFVACPIRRSFQLQFVYYAILIFRLIIIIAIIIICFIISLIFHLRMRTTLFFHSVAFGELIAKHIYSQLLYYRTPSSKTYTYLHVEMCCHSFRFVASADWRSLGYTHSKCVICFGNKLNRNHCITRNC